MKLILSIVSNDDANSVANTLTKNGFQITKIATTGGFLKAGNTSIIVGVEDEKLQEAIDLIGKEAKKRTEVTPATAAYDVSGFASFPVEVNVGGATIFVLDVEQFIKF